MTTDASHNRQLSVLASAIAGAEQFDQQVVRLMQSGISEAEAEHWADIMPIAFARAAYRFQFSGPYPVDKQRDLQGKPPLADDPLYQQALRWASDCGAMDYVAPDVFNSLVRMSPEFEVIREKAGR